MEKANSVEAEIDEILETYGTDAYRWGRDKEYSPEYSPSPSSVRCQILSVAKKYWHPYPIKPDTKTLKCREGLMGIDLFQALKNSRRDGDEIPKNL